MQFEPAKTQYQPKTAAEVIATARLVRQRQMHRDAEMTAARMAAIAERLEAQRQERLRADLHTKWTVGRYRLAVDIEAKPTLTLSALDAIGGDPANVKIEHIQNAVCLVYGMTKVDLLSQRRERKIVFPRQVGMYLSKTMTLRSLPDIGRRFGGRDHTTVMHAVGKLTTLLEAGDERLASDIAAIKQALGVS